MSLSRSTASRALVVLFLLGPAYLYVASLAAVFVLLALAGLPLLAAYIYAAEPATIPISHRPAEWLFVLTLWWRSRYSSTSPSPATWGR